MAKKKGKKKGKKSTMAVEDQLELQRSRIQSLTSQLVISENRQLGSEALVRTYQKNAADLEKKLKDEKEKTFVISAEMTRQYKGMRKEMSDANAEQKAEISRLKSKIAEEERRMDELKKQHEQELSIQDQTLADRKKELSEMADKFTAMLKTTLTQMGEKIDMLDRMSDDDHKWTSSGPKASSTRTYKDLSTANHSL